MPTNYAIYGLTISAPFPCPSLPCASPRARPDVVVEDGPVPDALDAPTVEDMGWQAAPGRFLLNGGPHAGRFLVEGGTRVTIARARDAREDVLALRLLDAIIAAVLHQRGHLVLHATAVVTPLGGVVVSGTSGAGKSTTLSALLARGCPMLADDITVLRRRSAGGVEIVPGPPLLHLCPDAAEGLGQDISAFPLNPWRRMKVAVPTHAQMAPAPSPLRALFILGTHDGDTVCCEALHGAEKFAAVQASLYGPLLAVELPAFLPALASVTQQADVVRLSRPAGRWSVDEVALRVHNWLGGRHDR